MQVLGLIWGILALIGSIVAFLPCLGSFNWLNIPFASVGFIFSIVALFTATPDKKGSAIGGVVCCGVAIAIGIIRLIIGAGVV